MMNVKNHFDGEFYNPLAVEFWEVDKQRQFWKDKCRMSQWEYVS